MKRRNFTGRADSRKAITVRVTDETHRELRRVAKMLGTKGGRLAALLLECDPHNLSWDALKRLLIVLNREIGELGWRLASHKAILTALRCEQRMTPEADAQIAALAARLEAQARAAQAAQDLLHAAAAFRARAYAEPVPEMIKRAQSAAARILLSQRTKPMKSDEAMLAEYLKVLGILREHSLRSKPFRI